MSATVKSAYVKIQNKMGGKALIQLYHFNPYEGIGWQSAVWTLDNGATSSTQMTVNFPTGLSQALVPDYWAVQVSVMSGDTPGIYGSKNQFSLPPCTAWPWGLKECQLKSSDSGQTMTFIVDTANFHIHLHSGKCHDDMIKFRDYSPITNIFVLMLENHSFDNLFAYSGIPGLKIPPPGSSNTYKGNTYPVKEGAPMRLTSDPGHEFGDVVVQLKGEDATYTGDAYGTINNSGYVANYATSTTEGPPPNGNNLGDVMKCFDTKNQLPIMYSLATNFAICDQWFSSLPGPTWPNRFFLHGASSEGMDDSPGTCDMINWESLSGFTYKNGSIFDRLKSGKVLYRIYGDLNNSYSDDPKDGSSMGWIPQVASLKGIWAATDLNNVKDLAGDLAAPYPYAYTFIEPNYGNTAANTYKGGSSQHPMDDMAGGEGLIKAVYEAIRNSPLWSSSLLIITYDEHGGFYDSQVPGETLNPGDVQLPTSYTRHNFNFQQLGVRVPAVVVSPLVKKGTVDTTIYDHSSVITTIRNTFSDSKTKLSWLTARDRYANDLLHLLTETLASGKPLNYGPTTLPSPVKTPAPLDVQSPEDIEKQPLPREGNLQGFLQIALKTEAELLATTPSEKQALLQAYRKMKTLGDAKRYMERVTKLVSDYREKRKAENSDGSWEIIKE